MKKRKVVYVNFVTFNSYYI